VHLESLSSKCLPSLAKYYIHSHTLPSNSFTIPIHHSIPLSSTLLNPLPITALPSTRATQLLSYSQKQLDEALVPPAHPTHHNTVMKLLTAEDEAKFYQYVSTHMRRSTDFQLTLPQCDSQRRHDRWSCRPSSRFRWRLRRLKTLPSHPQPHTALQSLPRRFHRLVRSHHLRRPRRTRL